MESVECKEYRSFHADKLKALEEKLFNRRFQHATGQLENPMRLRDVKKSIANYSISG